MPPGRRPKPTNLRVIEGNPGNRPFPPDEPEVEVGFDMPYWISGDPIAVEAFDRIARTLEQACMISRVDCETLAAYCAAFSRYRGAQACIESDGPTYETESGPKRNPHFVTLEHASTEMRQLLVEMGMTPAARSRVKRVGDKPNAANRFSRNTRPPGRGA